jgi:hypothetical protein
MFGSIALLILILVPILGLLIIIWKKVEKNEINTSGERKDDFRVDTYKKRMNWLLGYLIVAAFLFCLWLAFRSRLRTEWEHIIFCLFSNLLGAVLYGFRWRIRSKADPLVAYLAYYPFVIVAFSAFTFALTTLIVNVAHLSEATTIFYSLAFFVGIYCGQHLDNIKELGSIMKRVQH